MKLLDRLARRLVLDRLARVEGGELTIVDELGRVTSRGDDGASGLAATIQVGDLRFYRALLTAGSIGAADAYVRGWFTASDLTTVIRIFARDLDAAAGMESGVARLGIALARLRHRLRRNTRSGARANIHDHYDLGNEFFQTFLDPTMCYSSGIYPREDASLEEASHTKLERLCQKLALAPGTRVLEIGCGWGGFAIHAALHHGCHVTATTISRAQFDLASERVRAAGVEDLVTLTMTDYRDLQGQFDRIVSIEMIEAVGDENLGAYFGQCARLLRPDGLMGLQAITIPEHRYADYRRSVDFIQARVFPGSCVPSITAMSSAMAGDSDLRLLHLEDFGPHYARTLAAWRERFFDNLNEVRRLGYDEELIRMWDFYLSYCEAGFAERATGVVQMVLARPRARHEPILPALVTPARGLEIGETA